MSCQCHQIGGSFIAEDPDCPAHGAGGYLEQVEALQDREALYETFVRNIASGSVQHELAIVRARDLLRSLGKWDA